MPTSNKIELFARNNNLREGWLSLGNQLGENYNTCRQNVVCKGCKQQIEIGTKRFKAKYEANVDVCEHCAKQTSQFKSKDYFLIENSSDEDILHEFLKCNVCHTEPIYGPRFKCMTCKDTDICEKCFDQRLVQIKTKTKAESSRSKKKNNTKELPSLDLVSCESHDFECIELPLLANGLAAHNDYKCVNCYMRPIIGACFVCADCPHFSMCQNCYFTRYRDFE